MVLLNYFKNRRELKQGYSDELRHPKKCRMAGTWFTAV